MSLTGMLKWATDLIATMRILPPSWTLSPTGERVLLERTLEPDVGRREAEFGAAEDLGGALQIGAGVGLHRVDVAPGALQRIGEEDGAAAGGLHQPVDGADAPIDRLAGIPPGAGAQRERDLLAGAGEAHHL